jgi:hypothetical protein
MLAICVLYLTGLGMGSHPGKALAPGGESTMTVEQKWQGLFEWSKKENRGLRLLVDGQIIGGGVVELGSDYVELRNQESGSIVVRLSAIQAVMGK